MDTQSLYRLKIRTSHLELRIPKGAEIEELSEVAAAGIQESNEPHFMEEHLYGSYEEIKEWKRENWLLPLAVFYEGSPIGLVTIFSHDFPITKSFGCSYWIGLPYQGKGLGTEAFQAILALGFDGLSGQEAYVGAYADNTRSLALMEKVGSVYNGEYWMVRQGKAVKDRRMRLPKEQWKGPYAITLEELDLSLNLFT